MAIYELPVHIKKQYFLQNKSVNNGSGRRHGFGFLYKKKIIAGGSPIPACSKMNSKIIFTGI